MYTNGTKTVHLISGANSATYSKANITIADAGTYYCEVTSNFVGAGTTTGVTITSSNVIITVVCSNVTLSPINLSNGIIGIPYNQTIIQTGLTGTSVWSVSAGGLPTGLGIASGTGIISGTLGATGSFTFTVQVASSGCSATQSYTVVVVCPVITFTNTTASGGGVINTPYTLNAGATGNNVPLTYSVSPVLPAGLSINPATGVISGTPTTLTASATYTVTADQSAGICTKTQTYTFGITNCVLFALSPNKNFLPDGFVNVPYVGATISVANPAAGVTYKFFKRNAIN